MQMRPAGYNFPGGMSAQRPNMGMQQATMQQGTMQQGNMQQGTMGMPQGPMSPVISGVGSMPPPQVSQHFPLSHQIKEVLRYNSLLVPMIACCAYQILVHAHWALIAMGSSIPFWHAMILCCTQTTQMRACFTSDVKLTYSCT